MGSVWCERGNGVGGRVGLAVVCVCGAPILKWESWEVGL